LFFASRQSAGKVPDKWSSAIATPLYKGGISSAVPNYWPVCSIALHVDYDYGAYHYR